MTEQIDADVCVVGAGYGGSPPLAASPKPASKDLLWGSSTYFCDPDGNSWSVQQIPTYE